MLPVAAKTQMYSLCSLSILTISILPRYWSTYCANYCVVYLYSTVWGKIEEFLCIIPSTVLYEDINSFWVINADHKVPLSIFDVVDETHHLRTTTTFIPTASTAYHGRYQGKTDALRSRFKEKWIMY